MQHRLKCLMLALVGAAICSGCAGGPETSWETLDARAAVPQVFFPGQVSNPATQQWAFALTPDGSQLFYATDAPRRIMAQRWTGKGFTPPQPLDDPEADRDGGPFVSVDGNYLYFSSWRSGRSRDLYRMPLRPVRAVERVTFTDGYSEVSLSMDRGGRGFVWTDGRANGQSGVGFYEVLAIGGRMQLLADASGLHTGDVSGENSPFVDPWGRFVIFANYDVTPGTREDLFVSAIRNGKTQPPVPLGDVVNTPFNDTAPWVSPDGQFLMFSSDRPVDGAEAPGDYQIWWVPVAAVSALREVMAR